MSQFAFLRVEFDGIYDFAHRAEELALSDPRGACFYARLALETMVNWLYARDRNLRKPYRDNLAALLHEPSFKNLAGDAVVTKANLIKELGNRAAHNERKTALGPDQAVRSVHELFHLSYWLVRTYGRGAKPSPDIRFDRAALNQHLTISASDVHAIKKLRDDHDAALNAHKEAEQARLVSDAARAEADAELARLRAEIADIKAANQAVPDNHDYTEAETRDAYIDVLLYESGWMLDQTRDREYRVTGMPSDSGVGYVDYVLWGNDGRPLAIIEAKRTKRDPRDGQQQAKLYADCLEKQFGTRPVIFYTNGYDHWIWDDHDYPPRPVSGFYKKSELELIHQRRGSRKQLATVAIDQEIVGRYYQTRAIRRIGETFERDHQRKALLVMATGTGKTRTVIALIDQLLRANRVKRVLFLADRTALVRQAQKAFTRHLPTASSANLLKRDTPGENDYDTARICLSTYPTMLNMINQVRDGTRRFGPGHFDLIVIDEAHRSVYRKYRAIFDYFDSLLVGLTATPRDEIDRDTYSLFELERGVPTDFYDLNQAVEDGFLVPPVPVSVPLKFQREGIKYDDLSDAEKDDWDAIEWDDDGVIPDVVESTALNDWLFNIDTVDKVLSFVMQNGIKVKDGTRLGKTIIFARNSNHAHFIAGRFDIAYPAYRGNFASVIDYRTKHSGDLIDKFSEPEKDPHIAVSVDMLDTGIDVPEVVNLVFFKPVRSKTKFWQMIGRGTRLCEDLFDVDEDKKDFRCFDFCENFEFFNQNPDFADASTGLSLDERLFLHRVDLIGAMDMSLSRVPDDGLIKLRGNIADQLHEMVVGMTFDNVIVRAKRRHVEKFIHRDAWQNLGLNERAELCEHLAGLPTTVIDVDTDAKRFDNVVLNAQLALLQGDKSYLRYRERIQEIARELSTKTTLPMVMEHINLIREVMGNALWENMTLPMLDHIRIQLRGLIRVLDAKNRKIIATNFIDEIGLPENVDLPPVSVGTDKAQFTAKVRHFLTTHADHIALLKIRRNEQLTELDLAELSRMFTEEGVTDPEHLDHIGRESGGLGLFLRNLVGLDREAAKEALSTFSKGRALSANQIEFIDMIIDHLTERGVIEARQLYESPFTDLDMQGLSGVFNDAEIVELFSVLDHIRKRAQPRKSA